MGFPRQEHWSGLPFLTPEDLPDPGIEHASLALTGGSLPLAPPGSHTTVPGFLLQVVGRAGAASKRLPLLLVMRQLRRGRLGLHQGAWEGEGLPFLKLRGRPLGRGPALSCTTSLPASCHQMQL